MKSTFDPGEYWDKLVAGDGRLANVGHPTLGAYNRWAYRFRLRALRRATRGIELAGKRVFKGGFGEGFYLPHWKAGGVARVDGVDISDRAVAAARAAYPESDLRTGDLGTDTWVRGLGRYDIVTAIDVLFHVTDDGAWERSLDNLLGLVDDGGVFLATEKFPATGIAQEYPHMRRRSLDHWESALEKRGFVVRRLIPAFLFMDDPVTDGHQRILGRMAAIQWKLLTEPIKALKAFPRVQAGLASAVALAQWLPETLALTLLERTPNLEFLVCSRTD